MINKKSESTLKNLNPWMLLGLGGLMGAIVATVLSVTITLADMGPGVERAQSGDDGVVATQSTADPASGGSARSGAAAPGEVATWKDQDPSATYSAFDDAKMMEDFIRAYYTWTPDMTETAFLNRIRPIVSDEVFAQMKQQGGPWEWTELKDTVSVRKVEVISQASPFSNRKWGLKLIDTMKDGSTKSKEVNVPAESVDRFTEEEEDGQVYKVRNVRIGKVGKVEPWTGL